MLNLSERAQGIILIILGVSIITLLNIYIFGWFAVFLAYSIFISGLLVIYGLTIVIDAR